MNLKLLVFDAGRKAISNGNAKEEKLVVHRIHSGKMIATAKLSINKSVNPRNLRQLTEEKLKIPREHVW